MNNEKNSRNAIIVLGIIAVVVFAVIYGGLTLTKNVGKSKELISAEKATEQLDKLYNKLNVREETPRKVPVELEATDMAELLPDISKFEPRVYNTTPLYVEIFTSTEKGGTGNDGWLIEVAEEFNDEGFEVNGQEISVLIRSIASGTATDYIASGKYIPDAFSPSNSLWGSMLEAEGIPIEMVTDRMVGNIAGVLFSDDKEEALIDTYGAVNLKNITDAVAANELAMGYTNPFASSTGLNFLVSTLSTYDEDDLLSDQAIAGFEAFQANVPFVAFTTLQMRESAKSGALDGFIMEYQTYINSSELRADYNFTPFGVRHDNPMYALGNLSEDKMAVLEKFVEFSQETKYQEIANDYGFNYLDDYKPEMKSIDGKTIGEAQTLWKEKKDSNTEIIAVFVADTSGSMEGEAMNRLKESLLSASSYINSEHSVGLVSFASNATINLPVAKFDLNQRSLFAGALTDMQANGGTAMFDGIIVATKMLMEQKTLNPNAKLMLFVLTDGDTNRGNNFNDVEEILEVLEIPIYTIGYNANVQVLENLSNINEAATINADTDDVSYKLQNLFNAQM